MKKHYQELIYDYIIKGISQKRLASQEGCKEEEIKYLIKDLGFNKTNDGTWAGDDFNTWGTLLTRAKFSEKEICGFISDYSDRYAKNSSINFEDYLRNELGLDNVKRLPINFAEEWRQSAYCEVVEKPIHKKKAKKKVSLASELFSLICLILFIGFFIKFGKYILIVLGVVFLLGIVYVIISKVVEKG